MKNHNDNKKNFIDSRFTVLKTTKSTTSIDHMIFTLSNSLKTKIDFAVFNSDKPRNLFVAQYCTLHDHQS